MQNPSTTSKDTISDNDALKLQCERINSMSGNLTGYDCPKCKNRGNYVKIIDGELVQIQCECLKIRKYYRLVQQSGLSEAVRAHTLKNYLVHNQWQESVKKLAIRFLNERERWWYIGGSVGAGKTHICTAIANHFLKKMIPVKYMLWRDEISRIVAKATEDADRQAMLEPLKSVDVLYIDDLFKSRDVSKGELNAAFEIINARYLKPNLITIISSEKTMDELMTIDEAIGSRIYERCKPDYVISLGHDPNKNYRLRSDK